MSHLLLGITFLITALIGYGGVSLLENAAEEPQLGLATFRSVQLASDPDNGEVLSTDGTNNVWTTVAGSGDITGGTSLGTGLNIFDSESSGILRFNSLAAGTNVTLSTSSNDNTIVISASGGGGGSGSIGTSSVPTKSQLAYFTTSGATPELVSGVSTTTLTASSPLSLSQAIRVIGSSASVLSLDTSGTWTGNAGTATALAANGSNCSAGSFAAGVDASGAAEGCTDVWTEAENTSAAYLATVSVSSPLTGNGTSGSPLDVSTTTNSLFTGTPGQILAYLNGGWTGTATSSFAFQSDLHDAVTLAGEDFLSLSTQQITANAINPDNLASADFGDFTCNGTSCSLDADTVGDSEVDYTAVTLADFTNDAGFTTFAYPFPNAATSTVVAFSNGASIAKLTNLTSNGFVKTSGGDGTLSVDTNTYLTSVNNSNWSGTDLAVANGGTGLSTFGGTNHILYTTAADTLASEAAFTYNASADRLTAVYATTTALSATTLCLSTDCRTSWPSVSGNMSGWATSTPFGSQLLLYPVNGTEDVAFGGTGTGATTTAPFWWDVSATTTYIGNGGTGDSSVLLGPSSNEWIFGYDATDKSFAIASSTDLGTTNFLTLTKTGGYKLNQLTSNGILKTSGGDGTLTVDTSTYATWTYPFPNAATSTLLTLSGGLNASGGTATFGTLAGALDAGGATSLEIPNGSSPTVDAIGEIALDTTSGQLLVATSTNASWPIVIPSRQYASFSYSTSTAWTGTTTIPLGPAYLAETWHNVKCFTNAGTVNVSFYDGTNRMTMVPVSTTVTARGLTTNNTFTADEKRYVDIGTPASSPTQISCTVEKSVTRD